MDGLRRTFLLLGTPHLSQAFLPLGIPFAPGYSGHPGVSMWTPPPQEACPAPSGLSKLAFLSPFPGDASHDCAQHQPAGLGPCALQLTCDSRVDTEPVCLLTTESVPPVDIGGMKQSTQISKKRGCAENHQCRLSTAGWKSDGPQVKCWKRSFPPRGTAGPQPDALVAQVLSFCRSLNCCRPVRTLPSGGLRQLTSCLVQDTVISSNGFGGPGPIYLHAVPSPW